MNAETILRAARACLGTPFRHQGRQIGVGLDCAGLCICVAKEIGHDVSDVEGYGRYPSGGQLMDALSMQPFLRRRANASDRQPGDLLLMRFVSDPQHLAIFAGPTIIHAYESAGKCCEHVINAPWASRIVAAYAFRGVT